MPRKPKTTQPETPNDAQGRDSFQTPNYAVDMLFPFIPSYIDLIWECAAGKMKISDRLMHHGYSVYSSDIETTNGVYHHNFLTDPDPELSYPYAIITNPPFSLKYKFIYKALQYNIPFAFLIPFDMCQKMATLFSDYECQGLVPHSRINYITPTGKSEASGNTSYYHSFWITRYFELPRQLTFVELTKKMRENI